MIAENEIEVWTDLKDTLVEGTETIYKISSFGRVYNKQTQQYISQFLSGEPQYYYVNIKVGGVRKQRRVHYLMAVSFFGGPEEGETCDHKDRNKLNNHLSNLRWLCKKGQAKNRDCTVLIEDGRTLTDALQQDYSEDIRPTYLIIYRRLQKGMTYQESLEDYFNTKPSEPKSKLIELVYKDYYRSYESSGMWFPTLTNLAKHIGITRDTARRRLKDVDWNVDKVMNYTATRVYTVDGLTMTKEEHCKRVGTTPERVDVRMKRHGETFEQALKHKPQRIIKHTINGEVKRNKSWFEHFNIPPRSANSYLSKCKCMRKTLGHFGIDTSGMGISPYI